MKPRKSISELRAIVLQRRLRLACQAGRIMAGHEPGIVRGPLLPLRKLGEPVTLEQIKVQAVRSAINRHNGNKTAAAAELGIERQTIYSILGNNGERKRYPLRNVIQLATAAACLVVLVGCAGKSLAPKVSGLKSAELKTLDVRPKTVPPLPGEVSSFKFQESSALPARVKTNGVVTVTFDQGEPPQTFLVNHSTGQTHALGLSTNETIGGIRPGLNTFAVTNASGSSAAVTALVTADTNTLVYHGQMFRWPGRAGTLQRSADLVRWFDVRPIQSGEVILQTNNQAREFLRVKTP